MILQKKKTTYQHCPATEVFGFQCRGQESPRAEMEDCRFVLFHLKEDLYSRGPHSIIPFYRIENFNIICVRI